MWNHAAAGHMIAMSGLPQAAGFHKTLGQMMYQYEITPWDPKSLLAASLQRQQQLQASSPLRFISVDDGLKWYGSQLGGVFNILSREKFVQMSMQLFQQRGLHVPVDEARQFYDIFDSIDLYKNAQLSLGELAGGLSSFFGGTVEAKTNALFDLLAHGGGQILKSTLQELLKPYVWCMVPPNAEVLRPVLLPHITEEIYNDMSYANTGFINRQELQRWSKKANISAAIVDRVSLMMSMALQVAWREYEDKYKLQEYGQHTWTQNYGNQPQRIQDVGGYRYAKQVAPSVTLPTGTTVISGFTLAADSILTTFGQGLAGASAWVDGALDGSPDGVGLGTRRYSVDSLSGTTSIAVSSAATTTAVPAAPAPALRSPCLPTPPPAAGYPFSHTQCTGQIETIGANPFIQRPSLLSRPAYGLCR